MRGVLALVLALWTSSVSAAEFALRPLPSVLWVQQAKQALPSGSVQTFDDEVRRQLDAALRGAFPDAMRAGDGLSSADSMSRELKNLLYVGTSVSRAQVVTTRYGTEKTAWTLYVTGTVFAINLGTGETVAARSLTAVVPVEKLGQAPDQPDAATLDDMLRRGADSLAEQLVGQLKEGLKPGVVRAEVVGRVGGDVVVARGRANGAYVGETLSAENGVTVRIVSVADNVSRAKVSGKEAPAVGSTVERLGTVLEGGDAPRLLVATSATDAVLAAGITGANLQGWVGDALAGKGYIVLPSGVELLASQLAESKTVNVAYEALVGAQAVPDILVVPALRSVRITRTYDEASGSTTLDYEASVQATFVDVKSGTVLYSAEGSQKRQDFVQEGGRQVAVEDRLPALVKDAALALAATAVQHFNPRERVAPLQTGGPKEIEWRLDVGGFGPGTLVEVLDRGPSFKTASGTDLGSLDSVVGTGRVLRADAKLEVAAVVASAKPVTGAMRVRAVAGSTGTDDRVVELGSVTLGAAATGGVDYAKALRSSLYLSDKLRASVSGAELDAVRAFQKVLSDSGAFEVGATIADGKAATHRLDIEVSTEAPASTVKVAGKKQVVDRKVKVTLVGTLVDLSTGQPVKLVTSKGEEKSSASCSIEQSWTAVVRPGEYAAGFAPEDTADLVAQVAGVAAVDLARRIRAMADRAIGKSVE